MPDPTPAAEADARQPSPPAAIDEMLGEIAPANLRRLVDTLAGFGTRHTLSETESETRGIGAARRWMKSEFERYARESGRTGDDALQASFDVHPVEPDGRRITRALDIVNVVAVLPGSMPEAAGRRYYVIGHLDSRATDVLDSESDAPGANDDASGVALLMELARVMSRRRFDATLVFVGVTGEEQGLYGARLHARAARAAGDDIRAVLSNDMVGDPSGLPAGTHGPARPAEPGVVRVFSQGAPPAADAAEIRRMAMLGAESDSEARQLARYVAEVAALHDTAVRPRLVYRNDRFLRGGDHKAFLENGFPAVRFTDVHENYERQHQDVRIEHGVRYGDLPEYVDEHYLADVARLNAATLAHLANAPSPPRDARIVAAGMEYDTTLRWAASPEPDVAGYEVVWRETSSPRWDHATDVGDVTEATLSLSKDNWFFGVRAYDRDGHRSPVVFPGFGRE